MFELGRWRVARVGAAVAGLAVCGFGGAAGQSAVTTKPETVMTKPETKELFHSVDEIMTFASRDTDLAPVLKVKRRLVTRDEVNRYLVKNFDEDESAKRLQQSEIVLKKFGLLTRDFNLRPFLLRLLTEQIAGFYDEKTKTVNMLNWVGAEEQKPVLAHELTHALQDQKVGLEKWSTNGFHGASHTASEDAQRVQGDEGETARQAVTEGQAMVVFVDYALKPMGKTLVDSPEAGNKLKESAADPNGSPIMARAPLLLQRSLVFPYADGLNFEQELLIKGGKKVAFEGALLHPPSSSFEVLHPDAYLAHAPVPVLRLPDVHPLLDAEYEPYDLGVMGELDVEMMTSLFGGAEMARALAPAWNGGVYYAAQRKTASAVEKTMPGSLGVFYFSRWKSAEAARSFERIYGAELGRKYSGLTERKKDEANGEEQVFSTSEGDVLMSIAGDELFISEGYPLKLARQLREASTTVQGSGPIKMATTPRKELTWGVASQLGSFGMMRCAMGMATYGRYTSSQHEAR